MCGGALRWWPLTPMTRRTPVRVESSHRLTAMIDHQELDTGDLVQAFLVWVHNKHEEVMTFCASCIGLSSLVRWRQHLTSRGSLRGTTLPGTTPMEFGRSSDINAGRRCNFVSLLQVRQFCIGLK